MSFEAWIIFALFWVVFVTTPGPNAVNCISNGMNLGFARAMVGVLAILWIPGAVGILLCGILVGGTFLGTVLLTQRLAQGRVQQVSHGVVKGDGLTTVAIDHGLDLGSLLQGTQFQIALVDDRFARFLGVGDGEDAVRDVPLPQTGVDGSSSESDGRVAFSRTRIIICV